MTHDFKKGDRVVCVDQWGSLCVGATGTVTSVGSEFVHVELDPSDLIDSQWVGVPTGWLKRRFVLMDDFDDVTNIDIDLSLLF